MNGPVVNSHTLSLTTVVMKVTLAQPGRRGVASMHGLQFVVIVLLSQAGVYSHYDLSLLILTTVPSHLLNQAGVVRLDLGICLVQRVLCSAIAGDKVPCMSNIS